MIVNWAAGKEEGPITMEEITRNLRGSITQAKQLLSHITL
jgi:purine nucleoside phosphorylase